MRINLSPQDRTRLVKGLFHDVAPRYDRLNRILSLRRDVFWRRAAAARVRLFQTGRVLDLACGTGDLSMAVADRHPESRVIGIDFTSAMLVRALEKIRNDARSGRIFYANADALRLPFPDESFDTVTIAFGIRNIPDREQALKEMMRILVPGGRVMVLELSFPHASFIRRMYDNYLNRLIPRLGKMLTGQEKAYQYLADSIMDFPGPEEFRELMARCGLRDTRFIKLTLGIATLHWADKP